MIVVDASAVVAALLGSARSTRVLDRIERVDDTFHAPQLLDLEVASALRRYAKSGDLSRVVAERCLLDFQGLRIERHSHVGLLPRVWELRQSLTTYDAAYVALAELLDCPLLTTDGKLARSGSHKAKIELLN